MHCLQGACCLSRHTPVAESWAAAAAATRVARPYAPAVVQAALQHLAVAALQAAFGRDLVEEAGAPQAIWTEIVAPADSSELRVAVTWQDKTPTRLPEALWVRCARRAGG